MSEAGDDEDMAWRDAVPMVDPVRQQRLELQTLQFQAQMRAQQMYLEHGGMFSHGQHWQAAQTLCGSSFGTTNPAYAGWPIDYASHTGGGTIIGSYCAPTPVEDAGIRAGEIEGFRAWQIGGRGRSLHSMVNNQEWPPDGIMRGMPGDYDGMGVHAFKSATDVVLHYGSYGNQFNSFAFGRVVMWGTIVEHEIGYRSQFAKITAIDSVCGVWLSWTLRRLRRHYGLTGNE